MWPDGVGQAPQASDVRSVGRPEPRLGRLVAELHRTFGEIETAQFAIDADRWESSTERDGCQIDNQMARPAGQGVGEGGLQFRVMPGCWSPGRCRTAWRHRRSSFRPWGIAQAVRGEFVETLDIRGHRYLPTGATGPARTRRARTQAGPQLERVDRAHAGAARHPCSSRSCRDERAPRNGGACGPARPPAAARRGPRGGRAVAVTGARRPARRGAPLPESHRPVVGAAADHRGEPAWAEGPGRAGRGTVDAFSSSSTVVGGPLAFAGDQLQERPLLWSRAFANAVSLEEALIDKGGERRSPTGPFVTPGRNLLSPKDRIELEGHACGAAGRGTLPRRAHRPATLHRLRAPAPDGAESAVDNPLPIR